MNLRQIIGQEFFLLNKNQMKNSLMEKRFKDQQEIQEEIRNLKIYDSQQINSENFDLKITQNLDEYLIRVIPVGIVGKLTIKNKTICFLDKSNLIIRVGNVNLPNLIS